MANPKCFVGSLAPLYPGSNTYIAIENMVGINSDGTVLEVDGATITSLQVPFGYNDSALIVKNRIKQEIRDQFQNQNIQVIFMNDLSGILNL